MKLTNIFEDFEIEIEDKTKNKFESTEETKSFKGNSEPENNCFE